MLKSGAVTFQNEIFYKWMISAVVLKDDQKNVAPESMQLDCSS